MVRFMDRINSSPFRNRNWDIGLAQLGQLYAMWREKSMGTPTVRPAFPIGQSSPEAFLVPVSKIMAVKVALTYVCICMYMYVYVCTCMYMYVYVCICMYMHVYVCICMYMCICVCVYIYIYTHTYIHRL